MKLGQSQHFNSKLDWNMTIKLDKKNEIKPNWTLSAKTTTEEKCSKLGELFDKLEKGKGNSSGLSTSGSASQFDKPGLKDFIIKAQSTLKKKKLAAG